MSNRRLIVIGTALGITCGSAFAVWNASPVRGAALNLERADEPSIDSEKIAAAGQNFRKNCITCHQPPDRAFATDRAWLDQINRTA